MTQVDDSPICRRRAYRPQAGRRTFWEGQSEGETYSARNRRHKTAVFLCGVCPARQKCEQFLADMDRHRKLVDGVVAGEVRIWRRQY